MHAALSAPPADDAVSPPAAPGPDASPRRTTARSRIGLALCALFVLSGAGGLIYEHVWSRYLGLLVGHAAYAQAMVLVLYLGGMAIGAVIAGRRSDRIASPLLAYAVVELAVGVTGLLFDSGFRAATWFAYDVMFPALADGAAGPAKWLLAALMILPQALLLGATFPLMSAAMLRMYPAAPGRVLSVLYFSNSLGAAIGVLVAGFYLVGAHGLPGTVRTAAIINIGVAAIALGIVRVAAGISRSPATPMPAGGGLRLEPYAMGSNRLLPILLGVSFGTAVASFIYEIAWLRMLALVLGSATHSFELMLSAFILGLALGSLWIRPRIDRFTDPIRTLGLIQWTMGLLAMATLPLYLASFGWIHAVFQTVDATANGYRAFSVARYAICLAIMLPATFCAGMTLPLITRILVRSGTGERSVGLVYGINTVGSIVGAILAGFILLPILGLKGVIVFGGLLDLALGVGLLAYASGRRGRFAAPRLLPEASIAVVLIVVLFADFHRGLLTVGAYRRGSAPATTAALPAPLFYRDGKTATIAVVRPASSGVTTLFTNGKPDASLASDWLQKRRGVTPRAMSGDESTQLLLGLLPFAYQAQARQVAVIGQGSGMTSHFALSMPSVTSVVTIEIEPTIVDASRLFYPANQRVFDDPRSRIIIDDARAYFASADQTFDVIISEPSNPWVSGVAGLFTAEFYQRIRSHLAPEGVFGQWLHLYEITDDLVLGVLAALDAVFPDYALYMVGSSDLLIVAARGGALPAPDWSVVVNPALQDDVDHLQPLTPATLHGLWIADRAIVHCLLRGRPANSDFAPYLETGAEAARFLRHTAAGLSTLTGAPFDLPSALRARRVPFATDTVTVIRNLPRLQALTLGAAMRRVAPAPGATVGAGPHQDARYRLASLRHRITTREQPSDWILWLRDVERVVRELHGGTAGVADDALFPALLSYLQTVDAPPEAAASVRFLHGLAAWDQTAVLEAGAILRTAPSGVEWLPRQTVLEGLAVASLMRGDTPRARQLVESLGLGVRPDSATLRLALLRGLTQQQANSSQAGTCVSGD
jgi:predicted membrane-bound spermidine synthase